MTQISSIPNSYMALSPINANELLQGFSETPPPFEISWWPESIGWQVLFLLLALFLLSKTWQAVRSYHHNAYRRSALAWLDDLADYQMDSEASNHQSRFRQLPVLLRKTALLANPRTDISHLSGCSWEQWLDSQCEQSQFSSLCKGTLKHLAYAPNIELSQTEMQNLITQITLWVKHHRGSYD